MKLQTPSQTRDKYIAPHISTLELEPQQMLATSGTKNEPFTEEEDLFDWSTGNVKPITLNPLDL